MTNELPANQTPHESPAPSVSQRLEQLAQRANEAHLKVGSALGHGLLFAYEAGRALVEAFEICPKRKWQAWLAANFKPSRWTARRYMDFATECDQRFGGLSGATLHRIPPDEEDSVLKKLLVLPSGKKRRAPDSPQRALPSPAAAAALPHPDAAPSCAAQREATLTLPGERANPYLPLKELFKELMEGLRNVMNGDDANDGIFADLLLLELKRLYAELMDYLERDRLRRTA
ncbi:MAG TPA: hypothetical protein PK867_24315 [Pirellulales bacterium]|nr:hypothetical protein [Pirellulales bacterium]